MRLNDVKKRAPNWFISGLSPYLKSAPGRGKTTVVKDMPALLSERLGQRIGLVVINGPLLTPGDAIGYLMPKHNDDGTSESLYTDPFWFRNETGERLSDYDGGIVFVDEADKTDVDVKKVIGEAALSGRLGPHKLARGWQVWMAGNTAEHRSGSTKELDHLINRRMEIDITDDLESLLDWMAENGASPLAQAFAKGNPHIVFEKAPDKQGAWCTPRSLMRVDTHLRYLEGTGDGIDSDPLTVEEVSGMIGAGAAAQLMAMAKLQAEMPRYEEIVAAPMKVKIPGKPDAKMLTCYHLAARVSKDDCKQVVDYISREGFGKEFAVTFAKAACKRDKFLVATPAFNKWAMDNASLMAAIAG